jgi:hypothetical protein
MSKSEPKGGDEFTPYKPRAVQGPADRVLLRLGQLVEECGPEVAARRWAASLKPEEAQAYASVVGLALARRHARDQRRMRQMWETGE